MQKCFHRRLAIQLWSMKTLSFRGRASGSYEAGFIGDAELFCRPRFIPFGFAQGILNLESLHVSHGPLGNLFEWAFPKKFFIEHSFGQFLRGWARLGQLQRGGVNLRTVHEDSRSLDGVL